MHWNGKAKVAVSLGTHASEEGAARAYDRAALAVKGRGVRTNMDEEVRGFGGGGGGGGGMRCVFGCAVCLVCACAVGGCVHSSGHAGVFYERCLGHDMAESTILNVSVSPQNYADEVPFLSRLGQHPDCLVLLLRRGDAAFGEALARYRESGTLPEAPSKEKEGEGEGEGGGGGQRRRGGRRRGRAGEG